MKDLLNDAARRGILYIEGLVSRKVLAEPAALDALDRFNEQLPKTGMSAEETLALLDDVGSPASMAMAGPRFFGFVIGGSLPVSFQVRPSPISQRLLLRGIGYASMPVGTSKQMA